MSLYFSKIKSWYKTDCEKLQKEKKQTNILSWCIHEHWRSTWNALSDRVGGEEWHVYTLYRPSKTLRPSNGARRPRWETVHTRQKRKCLKQCEKENSTSCTKYIVTLVHVWRRRIRSRRRKKYRKKTIQTVYASCYTERHSVWYVIGYCQHILNHNCYKGEKRSTLSSNGNFVACDVSCVGKGLC